MLFYYRKLEESGALFMLASGFSFMNIPKNNYKELIMSKNTKTTTNSFSWGRILKFISFVAVICIGLALIFSKFISSISGALTTIGNVLSYIVVLASSFSYAVYKRNIWYYVVWAVAAVLIVLFFVL